MRFGVLAAVPLPAGLEPVPEGVLATLHPKERALALSERGRRQIEVAGGRVAWRAAAGSLGLEVSSWALLSDSARAPLCPPGVMVSLTHKEDLALALVAPSDAGLVGMFGKFHIDFDQRFHVIGHRYRILWICPLLSFFPFHKIHAELVTKTTTPTYDSLR